MKVTSRSAIAIIFCILAIGGITVWSGAIDFMYGLTVFVRITNIIAKRLCPARVTNTGGLVRRFFAWTTLICLSLGLVILFNKKADWVLHLASGTSAISVKSERLKESVTIIADVRCARNVTVAVRVTDSVSGTSLDTPALEQVWGFAGNKRAIVEIQYNHGALVVINGLSEDVIYTRSYSVSPVITLPDADAAVHLNEGGSAGTPLITFTDRDSSGSGAADASQVVIWCSTLEAE